MKGFKVYICPACGFPQKKLAIRLIGFYNTHVCRYCGAVADRHLGPPVEFVSYQIVTQIEFDRFMKEFQRKHGFDNTILMNEEKKGLFWANFNKILLLIVVLGIFFIIIMLFVVMME